MNNKKLRSKFVSKYPWLENLHTQTPNHEVKFNGSVVNMTAAQYGIMRVALGWGNLFNMSPDDTLEFYKSIYSGIVNLYNKFTSPICQIKIYQFLKSERKKSERNSPEYRAWRKAVLQRDGCCVQCNSKERLEVDHIKPWAFYKELRFSLDNGRVLCHECHVKTDTYMHKIWVYKATMLIENR